MKFKFLLFIFIIWQTGTSQIAVAYGYRGKPKKLKKSSRRYVKNKLENFKKTKTIFVLSDVYDKPTYDSILKAGWHVTPYEIVKDKDFNFDDYSGNQYSYAFIDWEKAIFTKNGVPTGNAMVRVYLNIFMYDFDNIKRQLSKLSAKKRAKKIGYIFGRNKILVARIFLYPKGDFAMFMVINDPDENNDVNEKLYKEDVLYNYKPGFLKNYFQKISNLIQKNQHYWMFQPSPKYLPELKNLKKKTLYVPDFVAREFNGTEREKKPSQKFLSNMFKTYDYKYKMISSEELNKKIMNNEPIYYLMFIRANTNRFVSVVNAQTGEIVYRAYHKLGYKLKSKHIKKLNKAIQKAVKK